MRPAAPRAALCVVTVPGAFAAHDAGQRAARLAVRRALAGVLSCARARIEILHASDGAPLVRVNGVEGCVRVSITHGAGLAAALAWRAVPDYSAGVDLERERLTGAAGNTVAFTPRELALFAAAPEGGAAAALAAWTVKEAVWKALWPAQSPAAALIEINALHLKAGWAVARTADGPPVRVRVGRIARPGGRYWLAVAQVTRSGAKSGTKRIRTLCLGAKW